MRRTKTKTLHPSASGRPDWEDEPTWPALPWACPSCDESFSSHAGTVATIVEGKVPTFLCVGCDFLRYMIGEEGAN